MFGGLVTEEDVHGARTGQLDRSGADLINTWVGVGETLFVQCDFGGLRRLSCNRLTGVFVRRNLFGAALALFGVVGGGVMLLDLTFAIESGHGTA